jgi:putative polyhydroxyalkanoate system protein
VSSARIELSRPHALEIPELKRRLEVLRGKFAEGPGRCLTTWTGDVLKVAGAGFRGTITVGVDRVELDVTLGLFVAPLRSMIEAELAHELDLLVARDF